MNVDHILDQYQRDPRTQRLLKALQTPKEALQIKGLIGSQIAFVAAATRSQLSQPFLIIASDKEEAAYWQNDISALLKREALFFPDSYRRPMGFDKLDRTNVLQRTETVSQLVEHPKAPAVVVTYPEALFEKVVAPTNLQEAAIEIKVGTELDVPFLMDI